MTGILYKVGDLFTAAYTTAANGPSAPVGRQGVHKAQGIIITSGFGPMTSKMLPVKAIDATVARTRSK